MMRNLLAAAVAALSLACGAAQAAGVGDPSGDFLPSFAGPNDADLDVTFFSVHFDGVAQAFNLEARMAGAIDPGRAGLYVIGVNTGTGAIAPFGGIGNPNVVFNDVVGVFKNGGAFVDDPMNPLNALTAVISGNSFTLAVPLALLPSTGFSPRDYAFNIWPRNGFNPENNAQISDFAPDNATVAAVPEPATWVVLLVGFGLAGDAVRRRRRLA